MNRLNRGMLERYEIPQARPDTLRAAIFGFDRIAAGVVLRILDQANRSGGDFGAMAAARSPQIDALKRQDGMLTLFVRGVNEDETTVCEERVLQSALFAVNPERDFEDFLEMSARPELELILIGEGADTVDVGLLARLLAQRFEAGLKLPAMIVWSENSGAELVESLRAALKIVSRGWTAGDALLRALDAADIRVALADCLCDFADRAENARLARQMNYSDELILWTEPECTLTIGGAPIAALDGVPGVRFVPDLQIAAGRHARILGAALFLCAGAGYLCGKERFSDTLRDAELREWIGRAFYNEILLSLPGDRAEIAAEVILTFHRLENPMNDLRLLRAGRNLVSGFSRAIAPSLRACTEKNFEPPRCLSLALSAVIMLYAGARPREGGGYEVQRGEESELLIDREEILREFSRLSHDMPAESLAYAALADRAAWGMDLRDVDGLEMRVSFDLSSIQRIGMRETLRLALRETENK